MASKIPLLKLNTGFQMPIFGLGTWKSQPGEVNRAVQDAIDVGYRLIDCAYAYGNEKEVGDAIQTKIKAGVIKREDIFVTSKLWNTFHTKDRVLKGIKESLANLQLDYLDLYLIHWPMGFKEGDELFPRGADEQIIFSEADFLDTWKAMEELPGLGVTKSIGVSNFNKDQLLRILENSKITPAVNQVECHPYLNQAKLFEFCQSKGIVLNGYSPLGSPDRPWAKPDDIKLLDDPKLKEVGAKYGKSPAQVVFRWLVQRGIVAIPKTVSKARLAENQNIFDFTLSPEDLAYVNTFNRPDGRVCHLSWNSHHTYYPFATEF